MEEQKILETENLREFIKNLDIDIYGIAAVSYTHLTLPTILLV